MTIDYLSFPSTVRFEVKNDREYFKLPAIQLCTGVDILLDRNKVMAHFNLTEEFSIKFKNLRNQLNEQIMSCKENDNTYCVKKLIEKFEEEIVPLDKQILQRIDYKQLKEKLPQVIISAKDYIKCFGEVHTTKGYRIEVIDNCEKYSQVIKSIRGNEFGICLTYFSDRKSLINSSFSLKDNDFIQFEMNTENLESIMFKNNVRLYLFLLIQDSNTFIIPKRENVINTYGGNYFLTIKYSRTTVNYLSWPYRSDCHHFDSEFC